MLSGVKTTLNNVAVKRELSWHGLSDFDSIIRSADAKGERNASAARQGHAGLNIDGKSIMLRLTVEVSGPHAGGVGNQRWLLRPDCAVGGGIEPTPSHEYCFYCCIAIQDGPRVRNAQVVDGNEGDVTWSPRQPKLEVRKNE